MAHLGHPLTGDWLYGTEDKTLITRPALHSYDLRFTHPLTGDPVDVTAPLPQDFADLL
jgi:23S rRNA pseudouridine1911/1915/1917 synthase